MKAIGRLLTMSADHKQNQLAADVYNYGFTNSGVYAGWDGSALFAANHITDAGATGQNTFGSGSTITVTRSRRPLSARLWASSPPRSTTRAIRCRSSAS